MIKAIVGLQMGDEGKVSLSTYWLSNTDILFDLMVERTLAILLSLMSNAWFFLKFQQLLGMGNAFISRKAP